MDKAAFEDFVIQIVRRIDTEPGFQNLARRVNCLASRRWRRLVRDYEQRIDVSKAMISIWKWILHPQLYFLY